MPPGTPSTWVTTGRPGSRRWKLCSSAAGTATRQAEINRTAQEALLRQSVETRDAVSGVNLDEEAANLMRYQQGYEASAQVIAVADEIFRSLLDAVGR